MAVDDVDAATLEAEAALAFGECLSEDLGDTGTVDGDAFAEEGLAVGENCSLAANVVAADAAPTQRSDGAETRADAGGAPKKVKLKKTITDRIRRLNAEANLPAPIRLGAVAVPLTALDEAAALEVLDSMLEERGEDVDPTAWVVATAKQRRLWSAWEKEQWEEWEAAEEAGAADRGGVLDPKILEKIRKLNQGGALTEPLRVQFIAGALSLVSVPVALNILCTLEERAADIEHPSGYVKGRALARTSKVMVEVEALNKGGAGRMDLINPLDPARVRGPLMLVTEEVGMKLLNELGANAMDIVAPTEWLIAAVEQRATPVAKKLGQILESTSLAKLNAGDALAILETVSERDALAILERLKSAAGSIRSPFSWLKAQVARKGAKGMGKVNAKGKGKGNEKSKEKSKGKGKGCAGNSRVMKDASCARIDDDWSEDWDELAVQPKAEPKVRQAMGAQPEAKRPKLEPPKEDWLEDGWPEMEEEEDEDAKVEERLPRAQIEKDGRADHRTSSKPVAEESEAAADCLDYADGEDDGE